MRNLNITGCDHIQENLLLCKLSDINLLPNYIEIHFEQELEIGKWEYIWYGDDIVSIYYDEYEFVISANGATEADLISKKDNSVIASVYDKYNNGEFNKVFGKYIKNDAQLQCIIKNEDNEYTIHFTDSNCYELNMTDKYGQYHYLECTLEDENIFDAIATSINLIPEFINDIK